MYIKTLIGFAQLLANLIMTKQSSLTLVTSVRIIAIVHCYGWQHKNNKLLTVL